VSLGSAHIHPEILPAGAERAEKLLVPRNTHSESANDMTGFCVFSVRQHYIYAAAGRAYIKYAHVHICTRRRATIYTTAYGDSSDRKNASAIKSEIRRHAQVDLILLLRCSPRLSD
jgi:hypothetical protein